MAALLSVPGAHTIPRSAGAGIFDCMGVGHACISFLLPPLYGSTCRVLSILFWPVCVCIMASFEDADLERCGSGHVLILWVIKRENESGSGSENSNYRGCPSSVKRSNTVFLFQEASRRS